MGRSLGEPRGYGLTEVRVGPKLQGRGEGVSLGEPRAKGGEEVQTMGVEDETRQAVNKI